MTLPKARARRLTATILAEASLGDVRVRIESSRSGNQRFAASRPTTSGDIDTVEISVTAATSDGRHATARGNRTDDKSLAELVRQAEAMAEISPRDPEFMPPLGKTSYPRVAAVDRKVASMDAGTRVPQVEQAIEAGRADKTEVFGFLQHTHNSLTIADRAGLFGHHDETALSMSCTCRTPDGSGSAKRGFVSHAQAGLGAAAMAGEAANWASRSRGPKAVDPGRYTVVFAPQAVADLLAFLVEALDHRAAAEGRSYFSGAGGGTRIGEDLFADTVSLWSDPQDRDDPARPIAGDGRPQQKVQWVTKGKLEALAASRYWADRAGVPALPEPSSLHMSGGTGDLEALVAEIDRGILVSRLWYNRMLAPESLRVTGLTRDGTFWIEGGKIAHPIKNLRYNDSPVTLLSQALALGRPVRAGLSTGRVMVVPPVVVEGFSFESVSDAV